MLTTLDLKVLWRNVCAARGTRTPVAEGLDAFLNALDNGTRLRLQHALVECQKGSDSAEYFDFLRWASACTHSPVLEKAKQAGLECTPSALFSAGCWLLDNGVEPTAVLMHAEDHPQRINDLKLMLAKVILAQDANMKVKPTKTAQVSMPSTREESEPVLKKPAFQIGDESKRLTLRLFGSTAAHTLEICDHRRAASFLGVRVVVIESAHPAQQGGFDWENKLSIQLTPEEMPEVIAVLLGIRKEASFSNHGTDRNKSVIFRNQDDGIQIVTSQRNSNYSVPVKTPVVYYLLDLFCRAMNEGCSSRSNADVIATVRGVYQNIALYPRPEGRGFTANF
jgi:hypothetical protein